LPPIGLTAIAPRSSLITGMAPVTITGTGLLSGARVLFAKVGANDRQ
jgi:hypothetical protein